MHQGSQNEMMMMDGSPASRWNRIESIKRARLGSAHEKSFPYRVMLSRSFRFRVFDSYRVRNFRRETATSVVAAGQAREFQHNVRTRGTVRGPTQRIHGAKILRKSKRNDKDHRVRDLPISLESSDQSTTGGPSSKNNWV